MKYGIMVVDDSRVVYASMKKMLEESEIEILGFCQSGEEALKKYGELQPDLVTMDIVMPGIDGMETARELLGHWPDARVLMVSSLAYDDTIQSAESLGAKGFLYKPFDRQSLLDAILSILEPVAEE